MKCYAVLWWTSYVASPFGVQGKEKDLAGQSPGQSSCFTAHRSQVCIPPIVWCNDNNT